MAKADSKTADEVSVAKTEVEESSASREPYFDIESIEDSSVSVSSLEDSDSIFRSSERTFKYYDALTADDIAAGASKSAQVLENYLGQHSFGNQRLEEFLEDAPIKESQVTDLESAFVLDLDLYEYDGRQHLRYSEGEVSREAVEYLAEESVWSEHTRFLEGEEKLFIRSNP